MSKTITHLLTQDIIIQRLRTTSGNKRSFQSTATVDGMVQALSREARQRLGIIEEQAYVAYFDEEEDVQEGDRIVDHQNRVFYAKKVVKKDYGINTHLEVTLEMPSN